MHKPMPVLPILALAATLALAACGNKGPLVRMPDEPPPTPVEETLPDLTPPEQVPATEVLPPPADEVGDDDAIPPPPDTGDDGA